MAKKSKNDYTIGVDLGGTKILAAVVAEDGSVIGSAKKRTQAEEGPEAVLKRITKTMQEAVDAAGASLTDITAIGLGAPGVIDTARGVVVSGTNMPGWVDIDVGKALRLWNDVPVMISNDVRVATFGEQLAGIGKGVKHFAAVFVGTGIGGGIVIDGQIYIGSRGSAGEIGHMVVMADGPYAVGGGVRGSIEAIASRAAIERDLREAMAAGRDSVLPQIVTDINAKFTSSILAKAVDKGDALTIEVLLRAAHYLGLHAATLLNSLDPEMLIYGGGVFEALGEWMLAPVRTVARQYMLNKTRIEQVRIVESKLGGSAGIVGAALMARRGSLSAA
ncbi:MAG: ROK family protein [Chloroflexi bacterium]|nr:ROK family protein [Chloroflexota bacterium]MCL5273564.1 ROK family protein [Chloroflexota bacterium]